MERKPKLEDKWKMIVWDKIKSSNVNYVVGSFLPGAGDEHSSLCFLSATAAIYKMKDLRFHIPSGFDLEEAISGMSFGC